YAARAVRVALFVTCLVDQIRPRAGIATVRLLRRLGCTVTFDPSATCCGQPAFNTGERPAARRQAQQWIAAFERSGAEVAVLPSGSCTAMVHHFAALFAADDPWRARAERMAARTHELSGFLVRVLGRTDVGARYPARVTWHDACHGLRDLGLRDEARHLLRAVEDLELEEVEGCDACCGFGGAFAVDHPELSVAIADRKIGAIADAGGDAVVSGDVGCLLQLEGRLRRLGVPVRALHLAEVLGGDE